MSDEGAARLGQEPPTGLVARDPPCQLYEAAPCWPVSPPRALLNIIYLFIYMFIYLCPTHGHFLKVVVVVSPPVSSLGRAMRPKRDRQHARRGGKEAARGGRERRPHNGGAAPDLLSRGRASKAEAEENDEEGGGADGSRQRASSEAKEAQGRRCKFA